MENGPMLRQAFPEDIDAMHRVRCAVRENRLRSLILSRRDYAEAVAPPGRGWVVELEDGSIAGFAVANASTGNIWALFVHPDHERCGHGRSLHDEMVAWLWRQGGETLWLTTSPGTRAQAFYEAAGWRAAGSAPHGELHYELHRTQ